MFRERSLLGQIRRRSPNLPNKNCIYKWSFLTAPSCTARRRVLFTPCTIYFSPLVWQKTNRRNSFPPFPPLPSKRLNLITAHNVWRISHPAKPCNFVVDVLGVNVLHVPNVVPWHHRSSIRLLPSRKSPPPPPPRPPPPPTRRRPPPPQPCIIFDVIFVDGIPCPVV